MSKVFKITGIILAIITVCGTVFYTVNRMINRDED